MCGITGFLTVNHNDGGFLAQTVRGMSDRLSHRGPDDSGTWVDVEGGVAFGHRRLSIVDLSPAGQQPMLSAGGRYVVAFNGEIYNHMVLRSELQSLGAENVWRGHSDTETLLAGIEHWGLEATLNRCVGMFAIALWDRATRTLYLARDRFGEKPLYFGWVGQSTERAFAFSSELKALRAYPGFRNSISRKALVQYLRFTHVPAPMSIYEDIFKLDPGCLLSTSSVNARCQIRRWWSLQTAVRAGLASPIREDVEAVQMLEVRLAEAVQLQSLAEVPLGAFLSGGVDSSTVVALMQQQASRPVKTYTVGFEDAGFDESPHAQAVAQHLGTEHHSLFVGSREARDVIALLPQMYDEPFADSSQIPTHLVCRAARQQVTVALSGDGGDELFGGYNRYFWGPRIWNRLAWMPYALRRTLGQIITAVPITVWDHMASPLGALVPTVKGIVRVGDKAHKLAKRLSDVRDLDDLHRSLITEWQDPASVVRLKPGLVLDAKVSRESDNWTVGPGDGAFEEVVVPKGLDPVERMMYLDSMQYLPGDILCKVDRAAMTVGLETRVPFLDHRVVELSWRLPLAMKIRDGQGKWALRQVLYKYVPRELIDRPKAGFGIPIGEWLRGPLRSWAEALLDKGRLQREGYFYPEPILMKWDEHLSGKRDHTASLWAVLMFQAWLEDLS